MYTRIGLSSRLNRTPGPILDQSSGDSRSPQRFLNQTGCRVPNRNRVSNRCLLTGYARSFEFNTKACESWLYLIGTGVAPKSVRSLGRCTFGRGNFEEDELWQSQNW